MATQSNRKTSKPVNPDSSASASNGEDTSAARRQYEMRRAFEKDEELRAAPRVSAKTVETHTPADLARQVHPPIRRARKVAEAPEPRPKPRNVPIERALLGALVHNNKLISLVRGHLRPEHFSEDPTDVLNHFYALIISRADDGKLTDPRTLLALAESPDQRDEAVSIIASVLTEDVKGYAETIMDMAARRQQIVILEDHIEAAFRVATGSARQNADAVITRIESLIESHDVEPSDGAFFSVASLAGQPIPPREWHVRDLIPRKQPTAVFGDGGAGKSTLLMQLAACTVAGRPWLGHTTRRGPVMYLCAEDDKDELHRRFVDIAADLGVDLGDLADLHVNCLAGRDALLATSDERNTLQWTPLWRKHCRQVAAIKPELVIYDPLADIFAGNEIVRAQAQQFIAGLRGLALKTDSTAVLAGHPSQHGLKSRSGTSGSTAWSNSVRSRLYFEKILNEKGEEDDPEIRVLTTMKANYGPTGGTIRLRRHRGVYAPDSDTAAANNAATKQALVDNLFLEALDAFNGSGRKAGPNPSSIYAPSLFTQHPSIKAKNISSKALVAAMNRLMAAGVIRSEKTGRKGRESSQLVRSFKV